MSLLDRLYTVGSQAIDHYRDELRDLSKSIWSKPELNYEEIHAHAELTKYLSEVAQFKTVKKSYAGVATAFRATHTYSEKGATKNVNVAIICEYDALPNIGHACGHNLIAEAGIAAGQGMKAALEILSSITGAKIGKNVTITVLGTPAEEGGGGKIDLIKAGAFDDVDVAMMVHPAPFDIVYPTILSLNEVSVEFFGKNAHSSLWPWEGVNALDAMIQAFNNVGMARQQFKDSWRVHGVITDGGKKPNIIPEYTRAEFYLRAPTEPELKDLKERVVACFEGAAASSRCKVNVSTKEKSFQACVTNCALADVFQEHTSKLGISYVSKSDQQRMPAGSTDMGNVSQVVPSIHPCYSIDCKAANHTPEFTDAANTPVAHDRTLRAAKGMLYTALSVCLNDALLSNVKAEFATYKKSLHS